MHQTQTDFADGGVRKPFGVFAQVSPIAGRCKRVQGTVFAFRSPHLPLRRHSLLPHLRQLLPVPGNNCKTSVCKPARTTGFNLWCVDAPRFWCKVLQSSPPWPGFVGYRRRTITEITHFFCFSPKLTTCIIRSRLGGVPPSRPLAYLLDGI